MFAIAFFGDLPASCIVGAEVGGRRSGQPVDVAVEHTKGRSDQYSVMDIAVRGALAPGSFDLLRSYRLAALLHAGRNRDQRLQLFGDWCIPVILPNLVDQRFIAVQVLAGRGAMTGVAIEAVVEIADMRGDQLAFGPADPFIVTEQDIRECSHRVRRLGSESHQAPDAGEVVINVDVWHCRMFGLFVKIIIDISFSCAYGCAVHIELPVLGRPGSESVDIAVVHAEGGRDQYRVVDLPGGGTECPGCLDL